MANRDDPGELPVGQIIAPTSAPPPPIDVGARAREREKMTPTDRLEARADSLIEELRGDKESLRRDLESARSAEMPHLRADVPWLEDQLHSLREVLGVLRTSYEWAITFNWFSSALVVLGGASVSYAAFLPSAHSRPVATLSFAALIVGVLVQAVVSYRGTRTLLRISRVDASTPRPAPSPGASAVSRAPTDDPR